jgi:hypothetical protein
MGLFRSEEHVRDWSDFVPESEEAIMPVRDWARCFATAACRTRLEPDTLTRQLTYGTEMLEVLDELGRHGPRWQQQD